MGDKVLQEFGAICRQVLDELSRLSQHIPQKVQCPDTRVRLSAGLMQMNPAKPLAEHLDAVDKALYRAKRAGKNRIEIA